MDYRSLFINKDKVVLASIDLACVVGDLEEAVALNQVSYWIEKYKETNHNFKDGKYWVYNSYQKWHDDNFPFWHTSKIQRIFKSLEKKGLLISANYNNAGFDKTKWYSIDYEKLQKMMDECICENEQSSTEDENTLSDNESSLIENEQSLIDSDCSIPVDYIQDNTTEDNNRDYNTENIDNSFSEEKVRSNSQQVGSVTPLRGELNSFSGEKKSQTKEKHGKTYSKKELEQINNKMPYRAEMIANKITNNALLSRNVKDFVEYFLHERRKRIESPHMPMSDITLAKIVAVLTDGIKVDRGTYVDWYFPIVDDSTKNSAYYEEVVDEYFNTKFKCKTDYSLSHFTQENVLTNIMNHCGKENWCMSDV